MPSGDKFSCTERQKRLTEHIEESEKAGGKSTQTAERIAWATVNKQDGGAKKTALAKKTSAKQGVVLAIGTDDAGFDANGARNWNSVS